VRFSGAERQQDRKKCHGSSTREELSSSAARESSIARR
jgi:hypothetical protein